MEMIYLLVVFSLVFSFGFLIIFFWAVDNDQFRTLSSARWSLLEEKEEVDDE